MHRHGSLHRSSEHIRPCRSCTNINQNTTQSRVLTHLHYPGAQIKDTVPLEDLKAFKEAFGQETGASTTDLLQELDSTLELAYTVKETLDQDEALKTALISVGIGADTVERYKSMLQEVLQQILP